MESHFIPRPGTALTPHPEPTLINAPRELVSDEPTRERYRGRDFGIGYGNSSGYASPRRYVPGVAIAPFRVR